MECRMRGDKGASQPCGGREVGLRPRVGRRAYDAGRSADPADESRRAGTPAANKRMARKAGSKKPRCFRCRLADTKTGVERRDGDSGVSGGKTIKDAPRAFALVVRRTYGATGFRARRRRRASGGAGDGGSPRAPGAGVGGPPCRTRGWRN